MCSIRDTKMDKHFNAWKNIWDGLSLEDVVYKSDSVEEVRKNMITYEKMIHEISEWVDKNRDTENMRMKFNKYLILLKKEYNTFCKKSVLIWKYRDMVKNNKIEYNSIMCGLLQKTAARNLSGVTVITVLTSPYPDGQSFSCKHNCYYCPNEPDQPRSYLKEEPAVARANRNEFDAQRQMVDRIKGLIMNGHVVDKVEIIIEGGTYTEYPVEYLERFHRDLIYTANTYFDTEKREKMSITDELKINETAMIHVIGVCIETRPDAINLKCSEDGEKWIRMLRKFGVTRVQLGVQHDNDYILKRINRGHTAKQAMDAIRYLKNNCFKVDIHLMPDLPFSSPDLDKKMLSNVLTSPLWGPDQVKVYPCQTVPWTVIKQWHESGKYTPYADKDPKLLSSVISHSLKICPPWIRFPRVVRDIPLGYISGGNRFTNLRQLVTDDMKKNKITTNEIRSRECGRNLKYNWKDAEIVVRKYNVLKVGKTVEKDYFISFESPDRKCLFGFCRLRILNGEHTHEFNSLKNMGMIRELHVYGNVTNIFGNSGKNELVVQHRGFGKKMVRMAEHISWKNNCKGVAVISGNGVANYYRKLGYEWDDYFMVKCFNLTIDDVRLFICSFGVIVFAIAFIYMTLSLF